MTAEQADERSAYYAEVSKKMVFIVACLILLIVTAVLSCAIGTGYGFVETFEIVWNGICGAEYPLRSPEWWADYYVFNNVMPGVVMAVIAGAGLALAGTVMQSMMENPLADAYTTGISSGACLGAVSAMIMGFSFSTLSASMGVMVNAFIGAMVPAILIIFMIRYIGNSPATMILIGSALSFFFNSMVTLIMVTSSAEDLQDAYLWQIGSVAGASWADIPIMLVAVIVSSVLVQLASKKLNVLSLGENTAKSLGLDVSQFRMLCIILVSVLVASIICFTGIIGFIGLVAPHAVRYIIGSDNKFVVPASILAGALILVVADMISRLLYVWGNVPVGIVMSFIGAPVFLFLIIRRKSHKEVF